MATLNAVQSPRFEGTELHYFVGDTFTLKLKVNLKKDGDEIPIGPEEEIWLEFYKSGVIVTKKVFRDIQDNTLEINWDEDTTKQFKKGDYVARVVYCDSDYRRTILSNFGVCVE